MAQLATIYFDKTFLESQGGAYRVFDWGHALTEVRASDSEITSQRFLECWVRVLEFLGQEALMMRQVSTYFRHERFRSAYEASPIDFNDDPTWMFCNDYLISYFMTKRFALFTNSRINTKPLEDNLKASCITVRELQTIAQQMPRLQSLATIYLYMPNDYNILESEACPVLPIDKMLSHIPLIRWDLFLNSNQFPTLRQLKFEAAFVSEGLDKLPSKAMISLRCLELNGKILDHQGQHTGINMRDIFKVLKQVSFLEELRLEGVFSLEEETINLEPESLSRLKVLSLQGSLINPRDFSILVAAAPYIQELTLVKCSPLVGPSEALVENELPLLHTVNIEEMGITEAHIQTLLEAAPNLKIINIDYRLSFHNETKVKLPLRLYSSVNQLKIDSMLTYLPQGEPLFDLIERMDNLKNLEMDLVKILRDCIDVSCPDAYAQLTSFSVVNAHIKGSYLTDLLNRAKNLTSFTWENSGCQWMFTKLEEGALGRLTSVSLKIGTTSPEEIIGLLQKAVHLRDLKLVSVEIKKKADGMSFSLPAHSLPNLKNLRIENKITKEQCLELLRAASHLETLTIPGDYLSLFSEVPDGYFMDLREISFLCFFTEEEREEQLPGLLRVASNLDRNNIRDFQNDKRLLNNLF